jgi:hypothetical protein
MFYFIVIHFLVILVILVTHFLYKCFQPKTRPFAVLIAGMLGFEIADGLRNISITKNIKPITDRPIRTSACQGIEYPNGYKDVRIGHDLRIRE